MSDAPQQLESPSPGIRKMIIILGCLLVVQLGFAAALFLGRTEYKVDTTVSNLLPFDINSIDKVTIESRIAGQTKLAILNVQKTSTSWELPDEHDATADLGKVRNFLEQLHDLRKGLPVTNTPEAFDHFKVGSENFEKLVTLQSPNQKPCKLFVGSSPAFKTFYVRLPESNEVYSVELTSIPTKPEEIIQKEEPDKEPAAKDQPNKEPAAKDQTDKEHAVIDQPQK